MTAKAVTTVDLTYELPLSYELSPLSLLKSLQLFTSLSKSTNTGGNTLPLGGPPESSPTRRQNSLATSSSFSGAYHIFCSYVLETGRWSKDHTHGLHCVPLTWNPLLPAMKAIAGGRRLDGQAEKTLSETGPIVPPRVDSD